MGATEFAPRLLKAPDAARYLGMSETTLRETPIPRRIHGALRLYDRFDLDAYASSLPIEGEGADVCDAIFGVGK